MASNIKSFKLDTKSYKFLGANEKVTQKFVYDKASGKKTEEPARDENTGLPLWNITVNIIDQAEKASDTAMVTVGSTAEPTVPFMEEIRFENLKLMGSSGKDDWGVSYRFSADKLAGTPSVSSVKKTA